MHRRRKISLQEQLFAQEKVLADIRECDESSSSLGDMKEDDSKTITNEKANSDDENKTERNIPFLHKVVADGDLELLSKLIENGADVNVCDQEGWPPLNTAIRLGKTECAALLLKHGAGDFFFQRQKDQYLQRLQTSKRRRKSHWI